MNSDGNVSAKGQKLAKLKFSSELARKLYACVIAFAKLNSGIQMVCEPDTNFF